MLESCVDVSVSGDAPEPSEKVCILICNHHCRVDWMWTWCLCSRISRAGSLRIILKGSLKAAPFFGWAMQAFQFIFLSRKDRTADMGQISSTLAYLAHTLEEPTTLLLFPEGTDLHAPAIAKSHAYADANGLRRYEHVLQPRSTGLATAMRALGNRLDSVYDLTIAYRPHAADVAKGKRPSEAMLFKGTFPRTVEVHLSRYARQSLPPLGDDFDEKLGIWLQGVWAKKEAALCALAAGRGTGGDNPALPLSTACREAGIPSADTLKQSSHAAPYSLALGGGLALVGLLAGSLYFSSTARYLILLGCCACLLATKVAGGLGAIERRVCRVW